MNYLYAYEQSIMGLRDADLNSLYATLHRFETKAARDAWVSLDPGRRKEIGSEEAFEEFHTQEGGWHDTDDADREIWVG